MNGFAFFSVWIPVLCFIGGIALLGYSLWRRTRKLPCLRFVIMAILLLLISIAPTLLLFLAVLLGFGPVPS